MRAVQAWQLVGERMRALRAMAGISLGDAERLSGWSKGHLSRAERGLDKPSLELVTWYDEKLGAAGALIGQFLDLEVAVREGRRVVRKNARNHVAIAVRRPAGNPLPSDFSRCDCCVLVSETVPDGLLVEPGRSFEKSWTVRNTGPLWWRDRWLARQGDAMAASWLQSAPRAPVAPTPPGGAVKIAISMRAPQRPGACIAYFKMTDDDGRPYFPSNAPLSCSVYVPDR